MSYFIRKMQMTATALVIITTGSIQGSNCSESSTNCCEPCGRFFVDAQMLYLRAFEGGLSNVCDSVEIIDTTVGGVLISRLTAEAHDPDFRWNLGFSIGMGYEFANQCSDIGVYWTHYNSCTGHDNDERRWNINFNVVDVLWDYPFLTQCTTNSVLRLIGGLRCASIDQKLFTNFVSTIDTSVITSTGKFKEDFLGIGPLLAVEGDLDIGCGFSLYGNIGVGILYGRFHVKSNITKTTATGVNIDQLSNHLQACQPVLDAELGLRWETYVCNCSLIALELGLEHYQYFNHNQFCNYGDLSLDGVSLGIGFLY